MLCISYERPLPGEKIVLPVVQKSVCIGLFEGVRIPVWELSARGGYKAWLEKMCAALRVYFVLRFPMAYIQNGMPDNAGLLAVLPDNLPLERLLAVCLTHDGLDWFDYYLRLFHLFRAGCQVPLIVEDSGDRWPGCYAQQVTDSAWSIWRKGGAGTPKDVIEARSVWQYGWNAIHARPLLQFVPAVQYNRRLWLWKNLSRLQR